MIIASPTPGFETQAILSSHGYHAEGSAKATLVLLASITPDLLECLEGRIEGLDRADRAFIDAAPSSKRRLMRIAQLDLVRIGLSLFGIDEATFTLQSQDEGSPGLVLEQSTLFLSVSHCTDALAVALSPTRVGIDVERLRAMPPRPITHLFSPEEMNHIVDDESFTRAWVRKEAYAKWLGTGLCDSLAEGIYGTETTIAAYLLATENLYVGIAGPQSADTAIVEIDLNGIDPTSAPR
jgi:phosphopantetheinyl transferase